MRCVPLIGMVQMGPAFGWQRVTRRDNFQPRAPTRATTLETLWTRPRRF